MVFVVFHLVDLFIYFLTQFLSPFFFFFFVGFSFHESAGVRRNTNTPTSLSLLKETIAKMIEKTLKDEEEEGDEKEGGEEKEKGE